MFNSNKNLKRKISFGIIPLLILSFFLAPISPIFENHGGNLAVGVEVNKVSAQTATTNLPATEILKNSTVDWESSTDTTAKIIVDLKSTYAGQADEWKEWASIFFYKYQDVLFSESWSWVNPNSVILVILDNNNKYVSSVDLSKDVYDGSKRGTHQIPGLLNDLDYLYGASDMVRTKTVTGLTAEQTYKAELYFLPDIIFNPSIVPDSDNSYYKFGNTKIFTTSKSGETTAGTSAAVADITTVSSSTDTFEFDCGVIRSGSVKGCVAEFSYMLYEISAWIAQGLGRMLDFFVYYSTNSSSYTNDFVDKAFASVRDIANIFFIIALLYVAIKTILDLNVTNNKKLIGSIIIVALLINFSLFTTQIIIDSTNILAKVFYNQISNKDKDGNVNTTEAGGERSISVGLIAKFNPQQIIEGDGTHGTAQTYYDNNKSNFIFITLLATFLSLYVGYIFLMVALLFVGRVVALWLSMIFAPIAFASYTMPMNIPGLGHKDWWDLLLKNAFLAPIFIFFLYIIVMFAGFLTTIVSYKGSDTDTIQQIMSVVIPFAILAILLMKAKAMAVTFSGEIGKAIMSGAKIAGGFVGGAALGATALVGTGLIGGASSALLRSKAGQGLQTAAEKKGLGGFAARLALKTTTGATRSSFDLRNTGIGGAVGKGLGMNFKSASGIGLGTKEGGYQAKIEKRGKKAADEFENRKTKMSDDEVKQWAIKNNKRDTNGELFTTAEQLNNHRMKEFNKNIGKTGLISSLAYSITPKATEAEVTKAGEKYTEDKAKAKEKMRKEQGSNFNENDFESKYSAAFKEPTLDSVMDNKVATRKLIIGGTIALAAGALGAQIGVGIAAGLGSSVGVGAVGVEAAKLVEEERITRGVMGKQIKSIENIEERLKNLQETFDNQKKFLEDQKSDPTLFTDGKVNKEAVDRALAGQEAKKQDIVQQLKVLNEKIANQGNNSALQKAKNDLLTDSAEITVKTAKLNELKTIEEKINNTQLSMYGIRKDKSKLGAPGGSSSGPKPSAPTK